MLIQSDMWCFQCRSVVKPGEFCKSQLGTALCPCGQEQQASKSPLPDSPATTATHERSAETRQKAKITPEVRFLLKLLSDAHLATSLVAQGEYRLAASWFEECRRLCSAAQIDVSSPTAPPASKD